MNVIWLEQLWEAVKSSSAVSLIISLEEEDDREFNAFLNVSSNVSTVMAFVGTGVDQTAKAVARDVADAVAATYEAASGRLSARDVSIVMQMFDEGAARSAAGEAAGDVDALKRGVAKKAEEQVSDSLAPLRKAKNVWLLKDDGTYEEITKAWRLMQVKAAAQPAETAETWMTHYADLLSEKGGLAVKVGDAQPAEMAGVVRRSAWEAKMTAIDEANRAIAELAGYDGVQVSAHSGCANDHLPYQGRVYSLVEFDRINGSLERPIGRGVMNCRHSLTYCDKDRASAYSDEDLSRYERESTEAVTYTGRSGKALTSSRYEASQYVRGCESNIRKLKQKRLLLSKAGGDTSYVEARIAAATSHYKKLCNELGENFHASRIAAYTLADLS